MQSHNPEDEIVILYWTKDIFDDEDNPITDEVWFKVVKTLDETTNLDFVNTVIGGQIYGALRNNGVI